MTDQYKDNMYAFVIDQMSDLDSCGNYYSAIHGVRRINDNFHKLNLTTPKDSPLGNVIQELDLTLPQYHPLRNIYDLSMHQYSHQIGHNPNTGLGFFERFPCIENDPNIPCDSVTLASHATAGVAGILMDVGFYTNFLKHYIIGAVKPKGYLNGIDVESVRNNEENKNL